MSLGASELVASPHSAHDAHSKRYRTEKGTGSVTLRGRLRVGGYM